MEEIAKNRLRLWLRSERAMGLPLVGPGKWQEFLTTSPISVHRLLPASPDFRASSSDVDDRRQRPPALSAVPDAPATSAASADGKASDSNPLPTPALPVEERRVRLTLMDDNEVKGCTRCGLSATRNRTVFGEGASDARLMFIGEGPGAREDQTGRPFVGPAGELLNRMIGAMGLQREQVYICNVVKCRAYMLGPPPKDRAPALEEVAACSTYLQRQVEVIRPEVIVALGVPATQFVLQTRASMSSLRGNWHSWRGIKVMPTWHPSYLLRREKDGDVAPKRQTWSDLQKVMNELGLAAPKK